MPEQVPIKQRQLFQTTNTKLAAALSTMGVEFAPEEPIQNIYTSEKPYTNPSQPGVIIYSLVDKSKETDASTKELVEAWEANVADKELDRLMVELEVKAPAELRELVGRLKKLLPKAILCYLRGGFENRERVLDQWRKAKPMLLFRRSENSFILVNARASDKLKRELGVPTHNPHHR